jgi:hypothetical protein
MIYSSLLYYDGNSVWAIIHYALFTPSSNHEIMLNSALKRLIMTLIVLIVTEAST